MSKLKKVLLMCTAYVLVAALAIGGTIAYLQDSDSDVNVMTLGNVKIEQNEYEWNEDGTELVDFTQAKPLFPYVGTVGWKNTDYADGAYRQFTMNNALDKYVTVENTGKSDAYVRTIFAFEMGELTADEWDTYLGLAINAEVGATYSFPGSWNWEGLDLGTIAEIDGHKYMIYVGTHKDALAAGEETVPSLLQVYMTNTATNEIVEKLDGNKNGTYDILVVSQAVQAAGFADAETALNAGFGEITTTRHPWADGVKVPVVVTNDEELNAAIEEGAEEIVLESGNYGVIDVCTNRAVTIVAASGADVTIAGINGMNNNNNTSNITIKGVTIDNSLQTEGWFSGTSYDMMPCVGVYGGNYTFENCTFKVSGASKAETGVMTSNTINKGVMNFTNCTFEGSNTSARAMQIYGNYDLNVTGCTFNTAKDYSIKYVGEEGCVATFKNNNVNATTNFVQTGSALYAGENYSLVFEGNTLATGINHVLVDNDEGQTITINGVVQ